MCSDVTWGAVENIPSNTGGDHLSRVEDSGLANLAGFLVKLHSIGEELGAKVSSLQGELIRA